MIGKSLGKTVFCNAVPLFYGLKRDAGYGRIAEGGGICMVHEKKGFSRLEAMAQSPDGTKEPSPLAQLCYNR